MVNPQLIPLFIIYGTPNGTTTFNLRRRDSLHIMTFMKDISPAEKQGKSEIRGTAEDTESTIPKLRAVLDWLKDYKAAF